MKIPASYPLIAFAVLSSFLAPLSAADVPPEFAAAEQAARDAIPLGGDFQPDPQQPVFVAAGHGGRIVLSRDDGATWEQVYFGHPGSDHSPWAMRSVAYTEGVFVVAIGWGAPTAWLASEDGVNWRHLTSGKSDVGGRKAEGDLSVMPGTWGMAGAEGVFVSGGYMTMGATPDFGKTITTFSLREFKDDPRPRKLVTHHVNPVWCGEESGRFLAIGNDRSKENPAFGNLYASDDMGKTWTWLEPELLNRKCEGYSGMVSDGKVVLIADKAGANVFLSADAGNTWHGPYATGVESRGSLSRVGDEFWIVGSGNARASKDGMEWRDLPEGVPGGKIVASDDGALVNIDRRRTSILRSTDGGESWDEVYTFEAPETEHIHGAQGLRDIAFGHVTEEPVK